MQAIAIALMRVFPKAIVLTTKSHFHVKRTYASIRGLVVRTITSGKTRIRAIRYLHKIEVFKINYPDFLSYLWSYVTITKCHFLVELIHEIQKNSNSEQHFDCCIESTFRLNCSHQF